jgi:Ser/Thr protein kinase RdoA (MazF antagonist)
MKTIFLCLMPFKRVRPFSIHDAAMAEPLRALSLRSYEAMLRKRRFLHDRSPASFALLSLNRANVIDQAAFLFTANSSTYELVIVFTLRHGSQGAHHPARN